VRTKDEALHRRRRHQILTAAAACFAERGVHRSTMQQICEASGVSAGALYRYFPSKDSIVVALVEAERAENRELVEHLDASPDVIAGLRSVASALVAALMDERYGRLSLEIGAEAARNPAAAAAISASDTELRLALCAALERGQRDGAVEASLDVEASAFLLMSLFDGMAGRASFSVAPSKRRLVAAFRGLVVRLLAPREP